MLLVEAERTITKGLKGFFSVKVKVCPEDSEYKKGDVIFTDANFLTEFILDDEVYENIFLLNETMTKGSYA